MAGLFTLLITLIILGLIFYVVVWAIGWIGVPEPFGKVIKAVVALIFIIYLLGILLGGLPYPQHFWRP